MTLPPFRTWILALTSTFILLMICYLSLGRWGLFLGLFLSLLWNYAMLLHKHKNSVEFFHGKYLQGQDPWKLNDILRHYEEVIRCPKIHLYLCQHPEPLCLISISHWQKPSLLISESLLNLLSPPEIESLLALCVSSLKNRNTFTKYTLDRMALTWISIHKLCDQLLRPLRRINLVKQICYFIAWSHWKIAFPQNLQAKADLETYKILSTPRNLAIALWKIHGVLDTRNTSMPHRFIHQSILGNAHSNRNSFQFIVPIEHRLQFLIGYFPI